MNLKRAAVRGLLYTGSSYATRFVVQLAVSAVLARLLVPADFGLVAMSAIVVNFLLLFRGAGLEAALQQRREVTADHLNAVYWYSLGSGAVLSLVVAASAPAIAWLFNEPRLVPVVAVSGITVFVNSASGAHAGILARALRFRALAYREVGAQVLAGVASVALAFYGFGVYALVLQGIFAGLFSAVFLWTVSGWKPQASFRWAALRELLGFGGHVTGFQVLNHLYRNLDAFLVGRFVGVTSLAFYRLAYQTMRMPTQFIHQTLSRVMFPVLSRMVDVAQVRGAYLRSTRLLAGMLFLPLTGMLVLAEPFIRLLYGPQWGPMAPFLRLFAIAGFIDILNATIGWLFKARGRPDLQLKVAFLLYPVSILAVLAGLRWGALGVAVAYVAVNYLVLTIWPVALRLVGLPFREVLRALRGSLAASAAAGLTMAGALLLLRSAGIDHPVADVLAGAAVGMAAYVGVLALADRALLREARGAVAQLAGARGPAAAPPPSPPTG